MQDNDEDKEELAHSQSACHWWEETLMKCLERTRGEMCNNPSIFCQNQFYSKMMPAVFQSLQDMDEQRVKMIQVRMPSQPLHMAGPDTISQGERTIILFRVKLQFSSRLR